MLVVVVVMVAVVCLKHQISRLRIYIYIAWSGLVWYESSVA